MPKRNRGPHLKFFQDRGFFYIVWYEYGRERKRSTRTADRERAEQALGNFLAGNGREQTRLITAESRLIADVLSDYAVEVASQTASRVTAGYNIQALLPFWGLKPVAQATPASCRQYMRSRRDAGIEIGTIARELGVLNTAINHDYKQGRIPAPRPLWRPTAAPSKMRWLTRQEVAKLLATARSRRRISATTGKERTHSFARWHISFFILMALYTGARKTAITNLRWRQVDMASGLIDLNEPGEAVTNKRRARVPIPRQLRTFLRIAQARTNGDPEGFVLEYYGEPIKRPNMGFRAVARDAGMPDVTPHTLRHTAATWMVKAGVPLWNVAKYLGHSTSATTERVYAHHAPDFLLEAKEALEGGQRTARTGGTGQISGGTDLNTPQYTPQNTFKDSDEVQLIEKMVGVTGIEPVAPTMSRSDKTAKRSNFKVIK